MKDFKKTCFVISPIGKPGSKIRKRADIVFEYIIEPATRRCRYEAIRADQISKPGEITPQIIDHIKKADIVIADLTGSNPNVFFEIGVCFACDKLWIQLIEQGEKEPFDVQGRRTIAVNHKDLRSANEGIEDIVRQIKAVDKDVDIEEGMMYREACALKEDGAFSEAILKFDALLSRRPDHINAYIMKGRIYLEKFHLYQRAVEQFQKVLEIDPKNRDAQYDLALTYYYLGELDKAIEWNQQALDQDRDFIPAIYNQAIYYVSFGEKNKNTTCFKKAIKLYEDVIKRNREYTGGAMFNLAALYARLTKQAKNKSTRDRYVKKAVGLLDRAIKKEGLERLKKVTGEIPMSYGKDLQTISQDTNFKRMIEKWKRRLSH